MPTPSRKPPRQPRLTSIKVASQDRKVLQDFLAERFSLSRRTAKAMVDGRSVWVNRRCVWMARHALETGDVVEIPDRVVRGALEQQARVSGRDSAVAAGRGVPAKRNAAHVRVLWQNGSYLVADKPAGRVSCDDPDSVEALLRVQEGVPTLQAVPRLDRDTSGCLLFAKNSAAFLAAVETFKTHRVTKTYHAIAAGRLKHPHETVDAPLDGQRAVTRISREATSDAASFLRLRIDTGRKNQIRRHLASLRHPVVGDRVFGMKSATDCRFVQVPRQMLHASSLSLPDPLAPGGEISVHSPLPADFRAALRLFGMGKGR